MGQNIYEAPERITDKKAAHAPRFDSWAVFNGETTLLELAESGVEVIHFDGQIRHGCSRSALAHEKLT